MVNDKVGTAVFVRKGGIYTFNGVKITAGNYTEGDKNYIAVIFNCWQEITVGEEKVYLPVLVVSGSTTIIDATNDSFGYQKFWLYEDAENGLFASNTVLLPKAGSAINIASAGSARFKVSFDDGTTLIDPIISTSTGTITAPSDSAFVYYIKNGENTVAAPSVDGTITLIGISDYSNISMIINYKPASVTTAVGIDKLAVTD